MADAMALPGRAGLMTVAKNRGLIMAILIVALPGVIIAQLPTWLMDGLLAVNITVSIVVLLVTIYVRRPLDFSVFPSLLLVLTLYRLVLNVATTRLILTNARPGAAGEYAAGSVIRAFGKFVAGNNALVGFIIFAILVIVQFVVITKGATRISEVAARFTLDAMPGKQMAIDADLNAGLITEEEARQRRQEISTEADFYGAMDGASKYVRGDAIAGILITIINIIGGLVIGMLQYKFTFSQAVSTYTRLTVGDGLVSQIPAFIVSVAAGLIVTRATSVSNLGEELVGQLTSHPRALAIAAGFIGLLAFTGLPFAPMAILAAGCGLIAAAVGRAQMTQTQAKARKQAAQERAEQKPAGPEKVDMRVDPLELEVGYGLIRLVDPKQGGDLLDRITMIRRQMASDYGLVVPPVRIRDNVQLDANAYQIKIRGTRVASGQAIPDQFLAMDSGAAGGPVEGVRTIEPAFGLTAYWIGSAQRQKAEMLGYTVVDSPTVVATHLSEIIRRHAHELLSREETQKLITQLKETAATVVEELIPSKLSVGEVQKVLQNLLQEGVSIRNLDVILETLSDYAGATKDPEILTEYARNSLARIICSNLADDKGVIHVVTLDQNVEETISRGVEHTERGSYLTLAPAVIRRINAAIAKELEKLGAAGHMPVMLVSPQIRRNVKRMTEAEIPALTVLSYNEIVQDMKVESHGMVVTE